jgi:ankyrin repeat protein
MEGIIGLVFGIVVTGIGLAFGVAGPIGIARAFHGERFRWWMVPAAAAVLLFCGLMFANNASRGVPFLNNPLAPMVCPSGFEKLEDKSALRRWDLPNYVYTLERQLSCSGELGTYEPSEGLFVLSGMILYTLFAVLYILAVMIARRLRPLASRPVLAPAAALIVLLPLLCVSIFSPGVLSLITRPFNRLVYSGHAVSLVRAVERNRVDIVRKLLADGGDIRAKNREGVSALSAARQFNNREILGLFADRITEGSGPRKALLERGVIYDEHGFFEQVRKNQLENVKLFLDAGFDIDALEKERYTALAIASELGHAELARLLLDRKADVGKHGPTGWAPLSAAAITCRPAIARLLIERRADLDLADRDGNTPLMMACRAGCLEAVRLLVDAGAKVNARGPAGYTPLLYAAEHAGYETAQYLLEHGADPGVNIYSGGYQGYTPLRIARMRRNSADLVKLLEKYRARE